MKEEAAVNVRRPSWSQLKRTRWAVWSAAASLALFGCGDAGFGARDEGNMPEPPAGDTVTDDSSLAVSMPTPVAWFSFDEKCSGTTVYDSQPLPATSSGSKVNGPACIEGKIGRGVSLDGVNDYVSINDRTSFHFTNAFTMSAWIKPSATSGTIAGKWEGTNSFQLALSSGKAVFSVALASGSTITASSSSTIATGSWTHVAAVYDGANAKIYVGGTLAGSVAATGNIVTSTAAIRVGALPSGASRFTGGIDELRLYGSALSSSLVSRLVNGIQHRRLRTVAFDPKFTTDSAWVGKRLHDYFAGWQWRTPDAVVKYWIDFLNAAAGQRLYLPEDGSYASAVKYVEEIPWNNNGMDCPLSWGGTGSLLSQTAEQARDSIVNGTGTPPGKVLDIFRAFKANNASLGFDLVADANGQYFHELMVITPPDWGFGKEGTMVANPTDTSAYYAHDGILRASGLSSSKKFIFHGVSFTRDDRNEEQFWHRAERMLATIWADNPGSGDACGSYAWWMEPFAMTDLRNAYDLFSMQDRMINGNGHVGGAHWPTNTAVEYVRDHKDRVPSAHQFWATYPTGFPLDLTKKARRTPFSCETYAGAGCTSIDTNQLAMAWQLKQLPGADGSFDGRSNNWWKYVSNPNYQTGRGLATTKPVKAPTHGGMDLTLTAYSNRINLKWVTEANSAGSYQIQRSTNRTTWTNIGTAAGSQATFDAPRPSNGVDTFYRVAWINGTTTLYSDQLGVNLGSATAVDVSGNKRPPINPSISLYQLNNPYVRWELPTSCGLANNVANSPCNASFCDGPCMACNVTTHECRSGSDGSGQLYSDYHGGMAKYDLQKRESAYATVWTLNRKPGWEGQYNHLRFSAGDNTVTSGTVVGYRVVAYQLDGANNVGPAWGQTDVLLAVPGQGTVGN